MVMTYISLHFDNKIQFNKKVYFAIIRMCFKDENKKKRKFFLFFLTKKFEFNIIVFFSKFIFSFFFNKWYIFYNLLYNFHF